MVIGHGINLFPGVHVFGNPDIAAVIKGRGFALVGDINVKEASAIGRESGCSRKFNL
jgi:hypothetical protein